MEKLRLHFGFLILCVNIFVPICSHGSVCLTRNHAALFTFGDSLFDPGNNNYFNTTVNYQANFSPYGETFFKYPSGRFTNGRVIPDFIAEYAHLPLILPYLYPGPQSYINGVNYASGGAGALVETHKGNMIDLHAQLDYFKNTTKVIRKHLGESGTTHFLSKAVYLTAIGSNDYSVRLMTNSTVNHSRTEFVEMVVGNLTAVVKEIYNIGGRKFAFLNLGTLGCAPSQRLLVNDSAGGCDDEISSLARLHNEALSAALKNLQKQLKGFKYALTNFYDISLDVINNPSKYGFKEGKVACCGSGPYRGEYSCGGKRATKQYELCDNVGDYVFFDSVHPTEKAYQHFAKLMWDGNRNVTAPYTIKELFTKHRCIHVKLH